MVVSEGDISNIMAGMQDKTGVRINNKHKLRHRFDIVKKLGQGTYGKVQLAINKETGQDVAIKTIKKAKIETEKDLVRIRREIQIMSSVTHPHIIHIFEVFENRDKMVLVMEYAAGGELYDYLSEKKVLAEGEARRIFRQVASACYYCHKHKICHRDLKLENILLDEFGNAKIADFGLSNVFDESLLLSTYCGSPLYASPEIVRGTPYIGPEVDCWSLGVLLYTLVYGAMPFDGSNFKKLVKQITAGDFYEPPKQSPASELIHALLTADPERRATVADVCAHWWVNKAEEFSCLEAAEELASQTPVRLDLLLSLAPQATDKEHVLKPDEAPADALPSKKPSADSDSLSLTSAMELDLAASPGPPPNSPKPTSSDMLEPYDNKAVKRALEEAEEPPQSLDKTEKATKKNGEKRTKKKKKPPPQSASNLMVTAPSETTDAVTDVIAGSDMTCVESEAPAAGGREDSSVEVGGASVDAFQPERTVVSPAPPVAPPPSTARPAVATAADQVTAEGGVAPVSGATETQPAALPAADSAAVPAADSAAMPAADSAAMPAADSDSAALAASSAAADRNASGEERSPPAVEPSRQTPEAPTTETGPARPAAHRAASPRKSVDTPTPSVDVTPATAEATGKPRRVSYVKYATKDIHEPSKSEPEDTVEVIQNDRSIVLQDATAAADKLPEDKPKRVTYVKYAAKEVPQPAKLTSNGTREATENDERFAAQDSSIAAQDLQEDTLQGSLRSSEAKEMEEVKAEIESMVEENEQSADDKCQSITSSLPQPCAESLNVEPSSPVTPKKSKIPVSTCKIAASEDITPTVPCPHGKAGSVDQPVVKENEQNDKRSEGKVMQPRLPAHAKDDVSGKDGVALVWPQPSEKPAKPADSAKDKHPKPTENTESKSPKPEDKQKNRHARAALSVTMPERRMPARVSVDSLPSSVRTTSVDRQLQASLTQPTAGGRLSRASSGPDQPTARPADKTHSLPPRRAASKEFIIQIRLADDEPAPTAPSPAPAAAAAPAAPTAHRPSKPVATTSSLHSLPERRWSSGKDDDRATSPPPGTTSPPPGTESPPPCAASPPRELIRSSRREFIIPIALEGGGVMTPPASARSAETERADGSSLFRTHQLSGQHRLGSLLGKRASGQDPWPAPWGLQRLSSMRCFDDRLLPSLTTGWSNSRSRLSRPKIGSGSGSGPERADSVSSGGEDDDDDQFELFTADSLFGSLMDRVKNMSKRIGSDDSPAKRSLLLTDPLRMSQTGLQRHRLPGLFAHGQVRSLFDQPMRFPHGSLFDQPVFARHSSLGSQQTGGSSDSGSQQEDDGSPQQSRKTRVKTVKKTTTPQGTRIVTTITMQPKAKSRGDH